MEKENHRLKSALVGDMIVPRRVTRFWQNEFHSSSWLFQFQVSTTRNQTCAGADSNAKAASRACCARRSAWWHFSCGGIVAVAGGLQKWCMFFPDGENRERNPLVQYIGLNLMDFSWIQAFQWDTWTLFTELLKSDRSPLAGLNFHQTPWALTGFSVGHISFIGLNQKQLSVTTNINKP